MPASGCCGLAMLVPAPYAAAGQRQPLAAPQVGGKLSQMRQWHLAWLLAAVCTHTRQPLFRSRTSTRRCPVICDLDHCASGVYIPE